MTSSPPCWWTKTKDLSLASFVRPPEVVLFSILLLVSLRLVENLLYFITYGLIFQF